MPTQQEYLADTANLGNYQYVSLSKIIGDMELESMDDDSYLKNVNRVKLIQHAKQGIKELNRHTAREIKAFEITIGDDYRVALPQDYVSYVRVSMVLDDLKLAPLNINRNIQTAVGYLQDNDYQILFDNDGNILTADSSNAYNIPYQIYDFVGKDYADLNLGNNSFLTDANKLTTTGEFTIDERRGYMLFSSNLEGRNIVIEYLSDGLELEKIDSSEITIHKYIETPLKDYIYYHCIQRRRNVPRVEKKAALDRYKTTKHEATLLLTNIRLIEIDREMRSKTRWL